MFVAVERDQPDLWMEINTLGDLDQFIVKPFWELHENKEDRMVHFRYKLCRLMEFLLDKRIKKGQRSRVALGSHPLPDNWVYPKVSGNSRLPPCAGGPIPATYAKKGEVFSPEIEMKDDEDIVDDTDEVKKERNEIRDRIILSFVDRTGNAKKNLELYRKAFESWVKHPKRASAKNRLRRKQNFNASWLTYKDRLQDYIQKNDFADDHGVCDECSEIAEKSIVCVFCNVCVHPVSTCCRFVGDWLSCIECHKTRHEYRLQVAVPSRADPSQDLEKQDDPSTNLKASPVANDTAETEDERHLTTRKSSMPSLN